VKYHQAEHGSAQLMPVVLKIEDTEQAIGLLRQIVDAERDYQWQALRKEAMALLATIDTVASIEKNAESANCVRCKFWVQTVKVTGSEGMGQCKRFPPTIQMAVSDYSKWPITTGHEWCGEFKGNENAQ
jgi:hypothetical protein